MFDHLAQQRFFRAKQSGITRLTELADSDLGPARWVLADVDGSLYQLFLQGDQDVLSSPEVLGAVTERLARDEAVGVGELTVLSQPVIPADTRARLSAAEQSNSSIIFDGDRPAIMKVFRMLEPGINPDVELLTGLARQGCSYVPALRAYSSIEWQGDTYVTAMVQDFAAGSEEGWARATATSDSFADDAAMIGESLLHVHQDLAAYFGQRTVPAAEVVAGLMERMHYLVGQAEVLHEVAPAVEATYRAAADGEATIQRIHGDAHLGQVLRSTDRYLFIDFEGEPARPLHERRQRFSPLQDVAGILRSFDYAAHCGETKEDPARWARDCENAFLTAYGAEDSALLRALILDKALYEVVYEANNRPDWLHIPLSAVQRLTAGST